VASDACPDAGASDRGLPSDPVRRVARDRASVRERSRL